ncbi:MAG: chromate transporter [Candidatus Izemoplasmatales bacterium]|jgi:chromate transporter
MMLLHLFWTFFKIGLFTFGGGYAMIPLIQRQAIDRFHWIDHEEFLDIIAIAESTPGPIAINTATYIGYRQKGVLGALMATLGVVLPSVVIIFLISLFLVQFKENPYIDYAFKGIRVGVSILVLNAGIKLFRKVKKNVFSYILMACGLGLMLFHVIPTIAIILIGGVSGIIYVLIQNLIEAKNHV